MQFPLPFLIPFAILVIAVLGGLAMLGRRTKTPSTPASGIAAELRAIPGLLILGLEPVGSRITCSPPPTGTDEDWLLLTRHDPGKALLTAGFVQDGSPEFYTGSDAGGFRSWRRGDVNVVTTESRRFCDLFLTATSLAKRFNLLRKADRIALFQAVLYGVHRDDLELPQTYRIRKAA